MNENWLDSIGKDHRGQMSLCVSHDFGGQKDYAATAILTSFGEPAPESVQTPITLSFLDRMPLGVSYHDQIAKLVERLTTAKRKYPDARLYCIVDATGAGAPGAEMLLQTGAVGQHAGVRFTAFTLTNGGGFNPGNRLYFLNGSKQAVVLNTREALSLRPVPSLLVPPDDIHPTVKIFRHELLNYQFTVTAKGHIGAEAARDSIHDDLVISVCLGVWRLQTRPVQASLAGRIVSVDAQGVVTHGF
jgi:hypothetical protein